MTAQKCDGTSKGRLREETRESRWYHGAYALVLEASASRAFLFSASVPILERSFDTVSESIIQIRNLTKTFGQGEGAVHALEDISLDIRQGEIFGIIGLSGAGKSTLVRCMNLLERPTSGTVIVDGPDAARSPTGPSCPSRPR